MLTYEKSVRTVLYIDGPWEFDFRGLCSRVSLPPSIESIADQTNRLPRASTKETQSIISKPNSHRLMAWFKREGPIFAYSSPQDLTCASSRFPSPISYRSWWTG